MDLLSGSRHRTRRLLAVATIAVVLSMAGCRVTDGPGTPGPGGSLPAGGSTRAPTPREPSPSEASATGAAGSGVPLADLMTIELEELRTALLGEEPYPSAWEAQVDELIMELRGYIEETRVPNVTGMDPVAASCALWTPLVGNSQWATGAFLERQMFIAHVAGLAQVAPDEIRPAAQKAFAVAAAGAAEQMKPEGDRAIVSEHPYDAIETIGRWAVAHCQIPVQAAEPPDTEGWTEEQLVQSCEWDRSWLEDAQEEYRTGPGHGLYAEHPHLLEVTIPTYAYTNWHRAVVDNAANPPTLRVEPIPGSICDS